MWGKTEYSAQYYPTVSGTHRHFGTDPCGQEGMAVKRAFISRLPLILLLHSQVKREMFLIPPSTYEFWLHFASLHRVINQIFMLMGGLKRHILLTKAWLSKLLTHYTLKKSTFVTQTDSVPSLL